MKLFQMTIHDLHEMLKKREVSCTEITNSVFKRIDKVEDEIKSYITITRESALKEAEEVDRFIKNGDNISPLTGIPLAIKDVLCVKGIRTTCGSKILSNFT